MSRPLSRIDRVAQMTKQEELIAKKRQELLEKKKTAELAKAVAAAQNSSNKNTKKKEQPPSSVPPPPQSPFDLKPKLQNTFCNDGSFLTHFKKILEANKEKSEEKNIVPKEPDAENLPDAVTEGASDTNQQEKNVEEVAKSDILESISSIISPDTTNPQVPPPPISTNTMESPALENESTENSSVSNTTPTDIKSQSNIISTSNIPSALSLSIQQTSQIVTNKLPAASMQTDTAASTNFLPTPSTTIIPCTVPQTSFSPTIASRPDTPPASLTRSSTNSSSISPQQISISQASMPIVSSQAGVPTPVVSMPNMLQSSHQVSPPQSIRQIQSSQSSSHQTLPPQPAHQPPMISPNMSAPVFTNSPSQASFGPQTMLSSSTIQRIGYPPSLFFNPNIPPPLMSAPAPPPPPPPPTLPIYLIPPPEPLQLNNIPPPKELDLNAIPKPEMNLDAIKIPECEPDNNEQFLPTTLESLIELVAEKGDAYEDYIRTRKNDVHSSLWFIFDKESEMYINYRKQVLMCRGTEIQKSESSDEKYDPESVCEYQEDSDDEYLKNIADRNREHLKRQIENKDDNDTSDDSEKSLSRQKKRKSRWGGKVEAATATITAVVQTNFANQNKPMLTVIQRTDPALLQYARQNYGTTNLTEEDWRKCEEHFKVNLLFQDMMNKRQEIDRLSKGGKFKYEYDSDEDVTGGTWEHKLRTAEMEATQAWADALTRQSEGKHHIGDFLPPEELRKFMEKYNAKKNNRQPDLSDYKEYKLKEDNIGFQMLQKLGWKEGQGLGASGEGIVDPVNKAPQRDANQGLGAGTPATPEECDNEYEAYRKRMMLAYRFRPNPLNNPRRAYY